MRRYFLTLDNRQVHYRRAGAGPPIILLHQSPTSSRECQPMMQRLLQGHTVIAPDMPGYGASDPIAGVQLSIELLADQVALFMDALGIDVAGVYGFHTGASVAIAFARRHPRRLSVAVAVGLLCPTADERRALLANYLPPLLPQWDGGHLTWLWSRLKDQSVFFPWYARAAAHRIAGDGTTPAAIQATLCDWLRCGEHYGDAYGAAFRYQPEKDLAQIRAPLYIVDYSTDPLFAHLDRLPAVGAGMKVVRCSTAADALDIAVDHLNAFPSPSVVPVPPPTHPLGNRPWQDYVSLGGGQLRVLRSGSGKEYPLMLQHGAQGSVMSCAHLLHSLSADRPAIAVELPGHGESDALPHALSDVAALASLLSDAAKGLGLKRVALIGLEAGASIQVELMRRRALEVSRAWLISSMDVSDRPGLRQALLDSYSGPSEPDYFGGHLLRAWHMVRDHALFFPWYERRREFAGEASGGESLRAELVHRGVVDTILSGAAGLAVRRAEAEYPLQRMTVEAAQCMQLGGVLGARAHRSEVLRFAAPRSHPRFAHSRRIAQGATCDFLELATATDSWGGVLELASA